MFYLTQHFLFSDDEGFLIYAACTAPGNYQEVFRLAGSVAPADAALLRVLPPLLKRMRHLDKQLEEIDHGS